jgi:hypothetical protein
MLDCNVEWNNPELNVARLEHLMRGIDLSSDNVCRAQQQPIYCEVT